MSVWKTTSRLEKSSNKDGQPTFNCLLLQFGVVAQGVQELADLMHEVENQPAGTILQVCCFGSVELLMSLTYSLSGVVWEVALQEPSQDIPPHERCCCHFDSALLVADCMLYMQVIAMRLNVKLSPDQERQLLESSMVPLTNEEDHILVIETASAMPTPAAVQQLMQPPATLLSPGPGVCSTDSKAINIAVCATMVDQLQTMLQLWLLVSMLPKWGNIGVVQEQPAAEAWGLRPCQASLSSLSGLAPLGREA